MRPVPGACGRPVAIGEPAHKKRIERRARDHAQLAEFRDGLGQAPIGHADTHAALNNFGNWTISELFHKSG